jgi:ketosteroid isomerase-like protein
VVKTDVELVEAVYGAYFRGDMEAMMALIAEDLVVERPPEQVGTQTFHGHEGGLEAMEDWVGDWDDYRAEIRGITVEGEYVLVTLYQFGRGKGSGVEVESEYTMVHTVEDGKVNRWLMFTSEEQAREALDIAN